MVFGWAEELGVGEILGEKMVAGTGYGGEAVVVKPLLLWIF